MQSRGTLLGTIALAVAFLAYQLLIHKVAAHGELTPVTATLVVIPFVAVVGWSLAVAMGLRLALLITTALTVSGIFIIYAFGLLHSSIILGLPHLVTNLFLMWYFARTLKAGRTSLITSIARRIHGSISPELEIYTRRVTWAWSIFFGLQIMVSMMLYFFSSLYAWSMFINILNGPLIVLMFMGEYMYRRLRYRDHKSSIFAGLKIFSRDPALPKATKRR